MHRAGVSFGRKRHGRASPLVKRITTLVSRACAMRVCAYINTGVRACIYLRLLQEHMAPVAARAYTYSRVHVGDNAVVAYLTVNADAFGVFNIDRRRRRRGRGGREGCLVRIATYTMRAAGCGINLGSNVSRHETSLVRRIDYAEGADKGKRGRARCL